MSLERISGSYYFYRFAESIVPLFVWAIITFPIWLSPFHPAITAYLILAYLLYFLFKSVKTTYYAAISFRLMQQATKISWHKKLVKEHKNHNKIFHYFIITNYKETAEKVGRTIEAIAQQNYDMSRVGLVLALEERERPEADERAEILRNRFKDSFGDFITVYHTVLPGEVVGKASNESYAAVAISEHVKKRKIDSKDVLITVCDADSLMPSQYLAYVTYQYLLDDLRMYRFYWAPVLLYTNFSKLILPVRVQSILSSITRLSILSWKEDLIQISTYSTNLWLLEQVGYWDRDIIPEDWHIWLQAFFKFGERVRTMPVYLPITRDGVYSESFIKTLKTRYAQERRWAWGASDIPYAIVRFFNTPHIRPVEKLKVIWRITETHLLWPTSFFILTVSASIPPLVNPVFRRTVLGFLLPQLSSFILTGVSVLILAIIYFDHKMRGEVKIKTELRQVPMLFVQWFFLPLISFAFSSLPALEAHTRMLLGKKLTYKVTEKV